MEGTQWEVSNALRGLLEKVESGAYGRDDDFDGVAFDEDLAELGDNLPFDPDPDIVELVGG